MRPANRATTTRARPERRAPALLTFALGLSACFDSLIEAESRGEGGTGTEGRDGSGAESISEGGATSAGLSAEGSGEATSGDPSTTTATSASDGEVGSSSAATSSSASTSGSGTTDETGTDGAAGSESTETTAEGEADDDGGDDGDDGGDDGHEGSGGPGQSGGPGESGSGPSGGPGGGDDDGEPLPECGSTDPSWACTLCLELHCATQLATCWTDKVCGCVLPCMAEGIAPDECRDAYTTGPIKGTLRELADCAAAQPACAACSFPD